MCTSFGYYGQLRLRRINLNLPFVVSSTEVFIDSVGMSRQTYYAADYNIMENLKCSNLNQNLFERNNQRCLNITKIDILPFSRQAIFQIME